MKGGLKLVKACFAVGFVLLLFSSLSAALGVVQDYPTTLSVRAGETLHYGIRVQNPSGEEVGFAIKVLKDGEVATVVGASSGTIPAYSKQAVVFGVKLPETVSKQEYKPTFQVVESKPDDPAKFIDTAVSPVFSFTVIASNDTVITAAEPQPDSPAATPESLYSQASSTPAATEEGNGAAAAFSIGEEGSGSGGDSPGAGSAGTGLAFAHIDGSMAVVLLIVGVAGVLVLALKTGAIRLQTGNERGGL